MWELFLSAFTTVYGLGGIALAAGVIAAVFYAPRLVPYLVFASLICGALGYVDELQEDLAAEQTKAETLQARAERAEALASENAAAAQRLGRQQGVDAAASDHRLAEQKAEAEKRLRAREAIARIEGADSVVCGSPENPVRTVLQGDARVRPKPGEVAPAIDAALDALAPAGRKRR